MKGITDIFISKDKLAIFWFLCACGCLVYTGWHVLDIAEASRGSMLYVPTQDSYVYLDRDTVLQQSDIDRLNELVDYQARLSLESLLNRGPNGPVNPDRIPRLFAGDGFEMAMYDIKDTRYIFKSQQIHQMMEIAQISIRHDPDGTAYTQANGQLVRVSINPTTQETVNEAFSVTAEMFFARNPNLQDIRHTPLVCTQVSYNLTSINPAEQDSESPPAQDR